jgi:hypothetical protein
MPARYRLAARCASRAMQPGERLAAAACGSLRCLRAASEHAAFPPVFSERGITDHRTTVQLSPSTAPDGMFAHTCPW